VTAAPGNYVTVDSREPRGRHSQARAVLRVGPHRRHARGPPTGQDHQALGAPGAVVLHYRPDQRPERGHEPDHREASPPRPRHPELRELSAPTVAALRRAMAHSADCTNQGPSPTPHRVEPDMAAALEANEPNMTWSEIVTKYEAQGLSGNELWNAISDAASHSRPSVNKLFGLSP